MPLSFWKILIFLDILSLSQTLQISADSSSLARKFLIKLKCQIFAYFTITSGLNEEVHWISMNFAYFQICWR